MKSLAFFLSICLGLSSIGVAAELVVPKTHPDTSGWQDLFAADLSNAISPKGVWSFNDGVLEATKDNCIWTKAEYENFIVDVEFKTVEGTNSGLIVYCGDIGRWVPNSIEVQIADDFAPFFQNASKSWCCGAIFGHLPAKKSLVKKPGNWNRMTVTCKGKMIYVIINGEQVTEMDMSKWTSAKKNPDGSKIPSWLDDTPLAELKTKGHIGLQGKHGKHGKSPIYFRNLKVKTF